MDERSSPDDASASRVSLVDSRRLLFEKIVTAQSCRSESTPAAAVDDGTGDGISRRNGLLPRSARASKVNSFRDGLASRTRNGCGEPEGAGVTTEASPKIPAVRRHSHNDKLSGAADSTAARSERVSQIMKSCDRTSPPTLLSGQHAVATTTTTNETTPSVTGNSSSDASDASPSSSSGDLDRQGRPDECLPSENAVSSANDFSNRCQSSADQSPPHYSKRISYNHAVLNGARLKLAKPASPTQISITETSCRVSFSGDENSDVSPSSPVSPLQQSVVEATLTNAVGSAALATLLPSTDLIASATVDDRSALADGSSSLYTRKPVAVAPAEVEIDCSLTSVVVPAHEVCESSLETSADSASQPLSFASVAAPVSSDEADVPLPVPTVADVTVGQVLPNTSGFANKTGKLSRSSGNIAVSAAVASCSACPSPPVDYPEELNPFSDDDDDNDEENDGSCNSLAVSSVNVTAEHDTTNPFGSDSEDELVEAPKSTPAGTNPFWSGSEEEEDVDDNPSPRIPVPLPRTVKKPITCSSPQPSPRPRPRVATGYSSNEVSPTSSCRKLSGDLTDVAFNRSSGSINSTTRKKKPAPLPPPLQANANHSVVSQNEEHQKVIFEQKEMIDLSKMISDDPTVSVTDLKQSANKKVISPWKNKKRPAPARPTPLRRPVKEMPLEDIKVELDDIEIRSKELERQTAQLEENIRIKTESESAESAAVEEMVVQLFELVNEKNELFRRRSELVNMRKMHSLEVEQADIEYQIRCLMLRPESNKTDTDKANEEALVKRLVEVVERRNEIIDLMDKDRLRETVEDESVTTQLDVKKNGHEKKDKCKEKKKKNKKEKTKEPDDGDKHSPSKLIKQKFMTLRHNAKKLHPKLPN